MNANENLCRLIKCQIRLGLIGQRYADLTARQKGWEARVACGATVPSGKIDDLREERERLLAEHAKIISSLQELHRELGGTLTVEDMAVYA